MATAVPELTAERPPLTATLHKWLVTVDHKKIGIMYVVMAIVFLIVAGCEAVLMRIQLWVPHNTVIRPDTFNQLFTMHGTTMVFFFGMPILIDMKKKAGTDAWEGQVYNAKDGKMYDTTITPHG